MLVIANGYKGFQNRNDISGYVAYRANSVWKKLLTNWGEFCSLPWQCESGGVAS
jgi:hypothetical protein